MSALSAKRNAAASVPYSNPTIFSQLPFLKGDLPIALIFSFATLLRFYHVDGYGLWSDEFVTLMIVSKTTLSELIKTCFEVPQPMPPLYFLLSRFPVDLVGPSETSLRLLSVISSSLTVCSLFSIGRILCNSKVGSFGALLCAINSTQIVYAQNARPYALCLLLSSLSILFFLKWIQEETFAKKAAYVLATTLLFYSHYIFFPLLLIQNLYFFWLARTRGASPKESPVLPSMKSWLAMQFYVGLLLMPLLPQVWKILQTRHTLNWASGLPAYYPHFRSFFFFLNPDHLLFSLAITLCIGGLGLYLKGLRGSAPQGKQGNARAVVPADGLVFLMLWYLVPVSLFFLSARIAGIHLFVERYLILSSLPIFLLIPAVAFYLFPRNRSWTFLMVYFLYYSAAEPGRFLMQKGQLSPGVPGGNQWKETLTALKNPDFQAPLFLFQSPFIESNQLNFSADSRLLDYLSSPLQSFYRRDSRQPFVLLPVHWWINNQVHLKFKAEIGALILSRGEFALLATQEFWDSFLPWLNGEFCALFYIEEIESFNSTGALRLKRMKLSPKPEAP